MDIELDLALEGAKPPVAARTPELESALGELLAAIEPKRPDPARRTRRLRLASFSLGLVAVAGGAAAAHAAGWLLPQPEDGRSWDTDSAAVRLDVTLSGGKSCQAVYIAVPVETRSTAASPAEWNRVWSTAKAYLQHVDVGSLTAPMALESYRAKALQDHLLEERTLPPSEVSPVPSEDEIRIGAPGAKLKAGLDAELRRHDLRTDLLVMTSGHTCAPGERE